MRQAEVTLEKSAISEVNKELIRRFLLQKTAENVKKPRPIKYFTLGPCRAALIVAYANC